MRFGVVVLLAGSFVFCFALCRVASRVDGFERRRECFLQHPSQSSGIGGRS